MTFSKLYVYFFFLMLPFVGGYISFIENVKGLTGEIVFLMVFPLVLMPLMLISFCTEKERRPKVSKIGIWYLLFNTYIILNGIVQKTEFKESFFVEFILALTFLIVIDNISYDNFDLTIFNTILIIVGIGTFVVSFIQLTVDPFFYQGVQPEIVDQITKYQISSNLFRNNSIFTGIGKNEGGIAISCLAIYFVFRNYYKVSLKYVVLTAMLFFSTYVTFSRYIWLSSIISLLFFVTYKYRKIKQFIICCFAICFIIIVYWLYYPAISDSVIFQERLIDRTIGARTESSYIFFKDFFFPKLIFGYGESSWYSESFIAHWGTNMGIHVGWVDIIFTGGLIGFYLYCGFIYQIYKKSVVIYKRTGNPIFLVFVAVFIIINFTAPFMYINFYGYYIMLFYLFLYYQLTVKKTLSENNQISPNNTEKSNI